MDMRRCPNLRKLPFDSNFKVSENLEEIIGEQEWWNQLKWEDQTITHQLTPYFKPFGYGYLINSFSFLLILFDFLFSYYYYYYIV